MSATEIYPEHEKLRAVKVQSQAIGEFLDYGLPRLGDGMRVYERITRDCECSGCRRGNPQDWHTYDELAPGLPVTVEEWVPSHRSIPAMLAEWFGIDERALAAEKDSMLNALHVHA
jgi:hypothetical protein